MEALAFLLTVRRECETKGCLHCRIALNDCPFDKLAQFSDDALNGFVLNAEEIGEKDPIDKWWEKPFEEIEAKYRL